MLRSNWFSLGLMLFLGSIVVAEPPAGHKDLPHGDKASGHTQSNEPNRLAVKADTDAAALMQAARESRYVWDESFPGFSASVAIASDGKRAKGNLNVDSHGVVDLKLKGKDAQELQPAADMTIESLVAHRMSSSNDATDASPMGFGELANHVAGKHVAEIDGQYDSSYHIKGTQLTTVHRQMGPHKMTISVMEVLNLKDGRHLPSVYTVSFWNEDSSLLSSSTTQDRWQQVGGYYLPKNIKQVHVGKDRWTVTNYRFTDIKLSPPEASSASAN